LVNRKVLVPSSSSDYLAIERFFFMSLMAPLLEQVPLNEIWYLETHPDVREAISRGVVKSAKEHYVWHGYYEHRQPFPIEVEEKWYISSYADVKAAIQRRDFPSGQAHFQASGFREGRLPYPGFSLFSND